MDIKKIIIVSALILANTAFAQLPNATTSPSSRDIANLARLEDLPASPYSPKMIEFRGGDSPEVEVLGVLFASGPMFESRLSEQDLEAFQLQKSILDSNSKITTAMQDVCTYSLSLDENNVSINEAEELAEKLKRIESDYSEKVISTYSDLLQSSSSFAIQRYEDYKRYIQARIVTKKLDYDFEARNNSMQFIQNQKNVCSHI